MPLYQYQYIDSKGKKHSGLIDAMGDREAKEKLREQGLIITHLSLKSKIRGRQNLTGEHLLAFSIQLSQLINAGVPLYESLLALEEQSRGENYHRVVLSLCEQIKSGVPLSQAMAVFPNSFDRLYCSMIAAGEAVGGLGLVLERLSQFMNKQIKLKKQIGTALIYPLILGGFSLIIICLLMGFVVPSLEGLFVDRPLNGFTKLVFSVSYYFRTYWWVYIPVLAATSGWVAWKLRSPSGKAVVEKIFLKLPLIRTLVIQTAVTRFCRTLSTLLTGGLNMIEALQISRRVMHNAILEKDVQAAEQKIIEGHSLSQELSRSKYFPKLLSRMLAVGEESGTSMVMLEKVAEMYEGELEKTLDRVMALAQPVILIVMGIIIGSVMLAILLPLTDVSSFSAG